MENQSSAQISTKAFIQSVLILLVLMIAAGVLTLVIPSGHFNRLMIDGREVIDPLSFQFTEKPDYPVWRWLTAPMEVLWGPDSLTIVVIIVFILLVAGAFAIVERAGIIHAGLSAIVKKFGNRKYVLLLVISFFFMILGAFFGLFEEIVPLVPIMIALAYFLGWDALVGLAMSILATNLGFSAAITNPFTIGVAQRLADLPPFSGWLFRIPIFLSIYAVFAVFIYRYAKKVDKDPQTSLVYGEDGKERLKYKDLDFANLNTTTKGIKGATIWFGVFVVLIIAVLMGGNFVPFIAENGITLPLVGLLFFIGGVGAGFITDTPGKDLMKALGSGIMGFLPGVILILMAASIKVIVTEGGVIDTILYHSANWFEHTTPLTASIIIYVLALIMELFIGSAGAKAVLLMPILLPLGDLVGVTRQIAVTAYCFGDGFSNLAYPTNPVLLIALGLASVGYAKWMRWTWPLWVVIIALSIGFLVLATAIGYGPF
ncbi:MAG: YfcC family protein [Anaerolineales bacterium]|nr:YfcC family protein [Anaerolineales bacterium]